eukprot:TRINITY_DN686_c1_g1_i2.p3 TRINITY_DN686_c1_g1~~TRINITY_DN686_c1_g1_i2.p3  ORF type:complete len:199 (+),score=-13.29 TRINITY_DN686_c1_g1_i2:1327-1923(+)
MGLQSNICVFTKIDKTTLLQILSYSRDNYQYFHKIYLKTILSENLTNILNPKGHYTFQNVEIPMNSLAFLNDSKYSIFFLIYYQIGSASNILIKSKYKKMVYIMDKLYFSLINGGKKLPQNPVKDHIMKVIEILLHDYIYLISKQFGIRNCYNVISLNFVSCVSYLQGIQIVPSHILRVQTYIYANQLFLLSKCQFFS